MRQSVKKGEPLSIPADEYNTFLQVANDYRTKSVAARPLQQERHVPHGLVRIKNATDDDLDRFSVLGIDGPLFSPNGSLEEYQNRLAFVGVTPTPDHLDKFAIIQEPLAIGAIGLAMISGISVVQVNVSSALDEFVEVADGQSGHLQSTPAGSARILEKSSDTSTSTTWAHVLLGVSSSSAVEMAVLDGALASGGSATASVWRFDGEDLVDTDENVTVYAWMLNSGESVAAGTQVWIGWRGRWYIMNAACPPED